MHGLFYDAQLIKGAPQEHWWRNFVDSLVRDIQPLLDERDALKAEVDTLRAQVAALSRRKSA